MTTTNYRYSLEGRRSGALAAVDADEMRKVYGARAEQMLEGMAAEQYAERMRRETLGGLSAVGDMTDEGTLPWHLPETGDEGTRVTRIVDYQDFGTAIENARMAELNITRAPQHFEWPQGSGTFHAAEGMFHIIRPPHERYERELRAEAKATRNRELKASFEAQADFWASTKVLGMVRKMRKVTQIEELEALLDGLTDTGRVAVDAAGWLDDGATMFFQVKVGDTRYLLGEDPHDLYLTIFVYYREDAAIKVMVSAVRVRCNNTSRFVESEAEKVLAVMQTGNVAEKLRAGTDLVLTSAGYLDEYAVTAERLARVELSTRAVLDLTEKLLAEGKPTAREAASNASKVGQLAEAFYSDPTLEGVGYNGWRYVNTVTRFFGPAGGDVRFRDRSTPRSRLNSVWDSRGPSYKLGRKATRLLLNR